jgi:hypothetical protein
MPTGVNGHFDDPARIVFAGGARGTRTPDPCLQNTCSLSDSVAHLGLQLRRVCSDRPLSDAVVVRFGGQCGRDPGLTTCAFWEAGNVFASLRQIVWVFLRGVLPYPDLHRRIIVHRRAARLVTCEPWPGDDATGADAAQLALYRLLWLQRHIRHAVRSRRTEEAALLARAAVDACIIGLYCLHSGEAVNALTAANNRAAARVAGYLTADGLISKEALTAAAQALGEQGHDPNLRQWAEWLEKEKGLWIATRLYSAYYVPLSHFFAHTNAFTLTRHVRPDGTLRRRPAAPWARRSAARLGDGCTGLLAAAIADKQELDAELLTRHAAAHLDRTLTPAVTLAAQGWAHSIQWHEVPVAIKAIRELSHYTHGPGRNDDRAEQEARVREGFTRAFRLITHDEGEMFQVALDEFVAKVVDRMNSPEA